MSSKQERAVGLIRVSRVKGRDKKNDGEGFHSPEVQRERIEALCQQRGWDLIEVYDENEGKEGRLRDASGSKALAQRVMLRQAVEAIEAGQASMLVTAYADRLTWTQAVRDEVLDRVEAAGGEVWTADTGRQSNGTAVEEFSGTTLTAAARFVRRQATEKARAAQVEAVEAGTWMSPAIPPGYLLGPNRRLVPDPETKRIVVRAFQMRAKGRIATRGARVPGRSRHRAHTRGGRSAAQLAYLPRPGQLRRPPQPDRPPGDRGHRPVAARPAR